MATEIDVINAALIKLGEDPIGARTDDSTRANVADATFDEHRDFVLQAHTWNFATTRRSLAADPTAPVHGYARAFKIPGDVLRVIDVVERSSTTAGVALLPERSTREPWKVEFFEGTQAVLTDLASPLPIKGIQRVTDLSKTTPMFRDALATYCAAMWAEAILGTQTVRAELLDEYTRKLSVARSADGREGSMEKAQVHNSWLLQR